MVNRRGESQSKTVEAISRETGNLFADLWLERLPARIAMILRVVGALSSQARKIPM